MPYTKKRNGKNKKQQGNKTKKLNDKYKKQQVGGAAGYGATTTPYIPSASKPSHGPTPATAVKSAPPPLRPREDEMVDLAVLLTEYKGEESSRLGGLQEAFTIDGYFVMGYGSEQKINKDKLYRFYENLKKKIEPKEINKKITIENNSEEIIIGLNNRLISNTNPSIPKPVRKFDEKIGDYKNEYQKIKELLKKKDLEIIEILASDNDFDKLFTEDKLKVPSRVNKDKLLLSKIQKILKFNLFISILQYVLFILHKRYINEYYLPQLEINKKFYENKKKTEYPEGLNLRIEEERLTKLEEDIKQIDSNIEKLKTQLRTRNGNIDKNNSTVQMLNAKTKQKEAKAIPLQKLKNDIKEYRENYLLDSISKEINYITESKKNLTDSIKKNRLILILDNMEKVYYYYYLLYNVDITTINELRKKINDFIFTNSKLVDDFPATKFNFKIMYIYEVFQNLKKFIYNNGIYNDDKFNKLKKIDLIIFLQRIIDFTRSPKLNNVKVNNEIINIQKQNLINFCKYFIYHLTSYNLLYDKQILETEIDKEILQQNKEKKFKELTKKIKTIKQYIIDKDNEFIVFKLFYDDIFREKIKGFIKKLGSKLDNNRDSYYKTLANRKTQAADKKKQNYMKEEEKIKKKIKNIDNEIIKKSKNLSNKQRKTKKKSRFRKLLNKFKTKKRKTKNEANKMRRITEIKTLETEIKKLKNQRSKLNLKLG